MNIEGDVRYEIRVLNSILEVKKDEWNALISVSGGTIFHTYEWLLSYESAPPSNLYDVRIVMIYKDGSLVAGVPLYHISSDPHFNSYEGDYGYRHDLLNERMLVCHSWYSYYNLICTTEPLDQILPIVLRQMELIAQELNIPYYGFPGVVETDPLSDLLKQEGFLGAYTEATSMMTLPEQANVQIYLSQLKPNLRSDLGRRARRAIKLGASVSLEIKDDDAEQFAALLSGVCEKHNAPISYPPDHMRSIFIYLREYLHFLSMRHGDTLLGGMVLLTYNGVMYAWIVGLNYDYHKMYGTYFALYYYMIEHACTLGINRIEAGRGLYDIKIRLGFRPIKLISWFKANTPKTIRTLEQGWDLLEQIVQTPKRIHDAYAKAAIPEPLDFKWEPLPKLHYPTSLMKKIYEMEVHS